MNAQTSFWDVSAFIIFWRKIMIQNYIIQNSIGSSETTREPPFYDTSNIHTSPFPLTNVKQITRGDVKQTSSTEVLKECYNFDFDNYIKYHQPEHKCKEDISITIHFLEWFIGFAEGDGSFESRLAEGRPRISFTIVQKDSQLLYKLKKGLGFGSVSKDRSFYRFRVDDKRGI